MKYLKEAFKYKRGVVGFVIMMFGIIFTFIMSNVIPNKNIATLMSLGGGILSVIGCQEFTQVMVALQNGQVPDDVGKE